MVNDVYYSVSMGFWTAGLMLSGKASGVFTLFPVQRELATRQMAIQVAYIQDLRLC
jgi:hypothetical protein